jgi:hypothetical protein
MTPKLCTISAVEPQKERRPQERQTTVLRVALLEQAGLPALCMLKNISPAGVQVKLYSRVREGAEVSLRVADEEPLGGRIAWAEGDIAGISFDKNLDSETFLCVQQKLGPARRRGTPRVSIEASAVLRTGGRTCRATVTDISSFGARVRTGSKLQTGARAVVELSDLPPINAHVRWSEDTDSGLVFDSPISIEIIADWIDGRVRLSA